MFVGAGTKKDCSENPGSLSRLKMRTLTFILGKINGVADCQLLTHHESFNLPASTPMRSIFRHRKDVAPELQKKNVIQEEDAEANRVDLVVPDFAWSLHSLLVQQANRAELHHGILSMQQYFFALFVIVASVWYGHTYQGSPDVDWLNFGNNNFQQIGIYLSTILVPMYVALLQKKQQSLSAPLQRWKIFRVAAASVEAEIYRFRTSVTPYDSNETSVGVLTSKSQELYAFVENHLPVKQRVNESFWAVPEEEAHPKLRPPSVPLKVSSPSLSQTFINLGELPQMRFDRSMLSNNYTSTEKTPLLLGQDKGPSLNESTLSGKDLQNAPATEDFTSLQPKVDDKVSLMSTDEYVRFRLDPQVTTNKQELPLTKLKHFSFQFLIKAIIMSTSAASVLSLQWMVPIMMGVVTALTSLDVEYGNFEKRAEASKMVVSSLEELRQWWDELLEIDRLLESNRQQLVEKTEKALQRRLEILTV
jgi:hypothetical protein